MSITQVKGRKVVVKHSSEVLFARFSDLNNFTNNISFDAKEKVDLKSTQDTILVNIMGFQIGMKIDESYPFTQIKYIQFGKSPVNFSVWVNLNSIDDNQTEFYIELDAELHGIFKLMSGKLQEVIDKVTDEIERGL